MINTMCSADREMVSVALPRQQEYHPSLETVMHNGQKIDLRARCQTQEVTDRHGDAITLLVAGWQRGKLLLCMVQVLPRKTKGMLENTGSQSATKNEKERENWV